MDRTDAISAARPPRRLSARARSIPNYLDTLDGFRAAATLLVLLFHYWQQSWVGYSWQVRLGTYTLNINLEPWIITGGLGVEILFLLSGFCLFYPLAMNPEREFNAREFAYKRFVRILPSYYLCFLVGAGGAAGVHAVGGHAHVSTQRPGVVVSLYRRIVFRSGGDAAHVYQSVQRRAVVAAH